MLERPAPSSIPDAPGSYLFKDEVGRVLYVGKASSLRHRLASYFQPASALPPKTAQMVAIAATVEWIRVDTDVEAVMLEYNLIKAHRPRFNIRLRDDKSYPYLAVTMEEEWPRPTVMRGKRRKGVLYFGPYAHAYAIRETLDLLLRSFPVRSCSDSKFRAHQRLGRPCLMFHIDKCAGPCVGEISPERYRELIGELVEFLDGETEPVIKRLESEMEEAARALEYERAARIRDRLASVRKAIERQQMVTDSTEDLDVIGLAEDELDAAIQVFRVRRGRVVGRDGFMLEKVDEVGRGHLMGQVLEQLYGEARVELPRQVLVPELPEDAEVMERWLTGTRGARVAIRVPRRGAKRALQATVTRNAEEELTRHRLRRASDHNARARALNSLQAVLDLPVAPLRIECFDMSHIQGSDYVGSMVVMEDGLPKKSDYRRFKVSVGGNDDYAAMEEVLTRRFNALLVERSRPASERGRRFAYPPQLVLLDGGRGQLNVGVRVLETLGLGDEIAVAALAKQFEEVYLPGEADPVRIPRHDESLYLLQRVRDEAHRFAITYHRQLRRRSMTATPLDGVPGLGPTRRRRLLRQLGGLAGVRRATLDELRSFTWLPGKVAAAVYESLHGPPPDHESPRSGPVSGTAAVEGPDGAGGLDTVQRETVQRETVQRPAASG